MSERPAPFFIVRGTDREEIARNQEEENPENAARLLSEVFDAVLDPFVIVSISDRTSKQRGEGGNTRKGISEFKIQLRATGAQSINGPGAGVGYVDELRSENRRLLEQVQDLKLEAVKNDYVKKIEEIKAGQKEDPVTALALQALAGMLQKPGVPVAVHGAEDGQVNQDALTRQQRLRGALMRLQAIDPDLDGTMDRIANWAEKNPAEYKTYLSLIPA